ncbi:MAG: NAD(P)-dependent oxidoreductase [Gammaproteobacteria bacterium]|nr:NAD(P)-dependent oxidoreductase [Gammaproteobacteria bacterium]MDH5582881.1 NAD(P)-dependent oxidoreductase [Gammaproteobacteria bacterium]
MKRVLLTGAGGYIGRHMLHKLVARGYEVHAVSRSAPVATADQIIWHSTDLLDAAATNKLVSQVAATHLMHLAWITEPGVYWESPRNDDWLSASFSLLESFAEYGGLRALLAGTCAEYDWSGGHCVEDKTPLRGKSLYAQSKLAFRDAAFAVAKSTDLSVAWARVFFSFGPHERPERLVPAVIRALLAGERARCVDGSLERDFMYVVDVADAMVAVLDSDFTGDINIASGQPTTLADIVNRIAVRLDASDRVDFGDYPRPPDDPQRITGDNSRLSRIVGWSPEYDLDSAIDETIAWWQSPSN